MDNVEIWELTAVPVGELITDELVLEEMSTVEVKAWPQDNVTYSVTVWTLSTYSVTVEVGLEEAALLELPTESIKSWMEELEDPITPIIVMYLASKVLRISEAEVEL